MVCVLVRSTSDSLKLLILWCLLYWVGRWILSALLLLHWSRRSLLLIDLLGLVQGRAFISLSQTRDKPLKTWAGEINFVNSVRGITRLFRLVCLLSSRCLPPFSYCLVNLLLNIIYLFIYLLCLASIGEEFRNPLAFLGHISSSLTWICCTWIKILLGDMLLLCSLVM